MTAPKKMTLALLVTAVAGVILRTVGLVVMTDGATGAVKTGYAGYSMLFDALLLALGAVCLAAGFFGMARPALETENMAAGFAGAAVCAAFAVDAVMCALGIRSGAFVYGRSLWGETVMAVLLVLSAVCMALFSMQRLGMFGRFNAPALYAAMPVMMLLRLILTFMKYTKYADIGENKLTVVLMAGYLLFWLYFARVATGITKQKPMRLAAPALGLYCGAVTVLPRLIAALAGTQALQVSGFCWADGFTLPLILLTVLGTAGPLAAKQPVTMHTNGGNSDE